MQYKTKIAVTFKREFKRLFKRYPSLEQEVKNLREEIHFVPPLSLPWRRAGRFVFIQKDAP